MKKTIFAATATLLTALAACTNDGYDTGDGQLSYLTAALATLHTGPNKLVTAADLDDGATLTLTKAVAVGWATKADSTYRALLYYDANGTTTVRARSVVQVPVLRPMAADRVEQMRTDPVGLESAWMAQSGAYLNLSLLLKAGKADDNGATQTIGIVSRGTTADGDGRRTAHVELYHDQGQVPEYYTVQRYASIDMRDLGSPDAVEITVNTYNGGGKSTVVTVRRDG